MIRNFALLDNDYNVIGTIALPGYLDFDKPHHVPHAKIGDGINVEIGMKYNNHTQTFSMLEKTVAILPIIPSVSLISSQDEKNRSEQDPPLPEGKRSLFRFFRRKK
jgi:hypothetical protein